MIQCPKCQSTLPDWAESCQFCQTDVRAVVRPKTTDKPRAAVAPGVPKWVLPAYYVVSSYFALSGAWQIIRAILGTRAVVEGQTVGWGFLTYVTIIFGLISVAFGIGLILRIDFIRGIVNFLCGLRIFFGILGAIGSILGMVFSGWLGVLLLVVNLFDIATGGLMIYLIGETD